MEADWLLADARTAHGLGEPIRSLRALVPERADLAWAETLAVLYDPPDRPPYAGRLEAPPLFDEEDP
ncbi:hypothetical protein O1L60_26140 [Streptomyces diastatochromogenes]|nr:hypothetical protein [Streptomyces diastatochromogenes]